jgi:hypothetical protein
LSARALALSAVVVVALAGAAAAVVGCYQVSAVNGGWKCNADNNYQCPEGLECDRRPEAELCVSRLPDLFSGQDGGFSVDLFGYMPPTSCDIAVRAGRFSNLTNLGAVNTAADEAQLALTPDGTRLYFMRGGQLMTSALNAPDGKSAAAAVAVLVPNAPAQLLGGSIASDGTYWFTGSVDGVTAALFSAPKTADPTMFGAAVGSGIVTSSCLFFEPVFLDGRASSELYLASPLGACSAPPFIARGAASKQLGAFYGAFSQPGFRAPSLTAGGLTLIFSSAPPGPRRLSFATRVSTDDTVGDTQWAGPVTMPLGSIGSPSGGDWQAIVSPSCATLYLVADRAGGAGGADLWAADITQ